MAVFNGLTHTRACLESLRATTEPFRLVVTDNGSSDGTPDFLERFPYPYPLTTIRSEANGNIITALNRAWRLTDTEFVCLIHNDTEMVEPAWLSRLLAALAEPGAGLAGLYGAKRLRTSGRLVGRTVVHSLLPRPTVRAPWEEVVFVDAVCLCISRTLLDAIGGLDEGYGFYHGIDRDLSMAVVDRGQRCLIVHAPFWHHGGKTRTRGFDQDPTLERADRGRRDAALARFTEKFRHRLPCDARGRRERVRDWLRTRLA
jgi:GT2 family glycosyltransferase